MGAGVKELLQMDETEQLKVTSTGLKVFERQESAAGVKVLSPSPIAPSGSLAVLLGWN